MEKPWKASAAARASVPPREAGLFAGPAWPHDGPHVAYVTMGMLQGNIPP